MGLEVGALLTEISQMDIPLFKGIKNEDMGAMLSCTGYHIGNYAKGQVIALENEQIRHVGIVLSGAVDMVKEDIWGNKTLLARIGKEELFGESFAKMAAGEKENPFTLDYELELYRTILKSCGVEIPE